LTLKIAGAGFSVQSGSESESEIEDWGTERVSTEEDQRLKDAPSS